MGSGKPYYKHCLKLVLHFHTLILMSLFPFEDKRLITIVLFVFLAFQPLPPPNPSSQPAPHEFVLGLDFASENPDEFSRQMLGHRKKGNKTACNNKPFQISQAWPGQHFPISGTARLLDIQIINSFSPVFLNSLF